MYIYLYRKKDIILSFNKHVHNLSNKESKQALKLAATERTWRGFNSKEEFNKSLFFVAVLLLPLV